MKNRTIGVNHQLIYKNFGDGCKFHVSEPKTDAGKRIIPMTETVHRAFVELRKQNLILAGGVMRRWMDTAILYLSAATDSHLL